MPITDEKSSSIRATQAYVDTQTVSLKGHFDIQLKALYKSIEAAEKAHDTHAKETEKALDARFCSQERAVKTALEANDKRLDGMNEFRQALIDREKITVSKIEFDGLKETVDGKFEALKEKINALYISRAELSGKASQNQLIVSYIFSGIGVLFGLIGLLNALLKIREVNMPYGVDKDLGGDSPSNTKWMEDCVSKVMRRTDKDGNKIPKDRAIAICKASFQKSRGNASDAEKRIEFILNLFANSLHE